MEGQENGGEGVRRFVVSRRRVFVSNLLFNPYFYPLS
jgi:hypothetical protein